MRLSEVNKEIEDYKKLWKVVGVLTAIGFVAFEIFVFQTSYSRYIYTYANKLFGAVTAVMVVYMALFVLWAYRKIKKTLKPLIEKRTKLEQDEQFIKRRVGIYEAADEGQRMELRAAYRDINAAYHADSLGCRDLLLASLTKSQMKKKVDSKAYGIAATVTGGTALGLITHLEAERRNDEIERHNSELWKKSFQQEMEGEHKRKEAKKQIEESEARLKELESEIERTKDVELKNWSYENYKDYDWSKVGRQSRMVTIEGVEYNVDGKGIGLSPVVDKK